MPGCPNVGYAATVDVSIWADPRVAIDRGDPRLGTAAVHRLRGCDGRNPAARASCAQNPVRSRKRITRGLQSSVLHRLMERSAIEIRPERYCRCSISHRSVFRARRSTSIASTTAQTWTAILLFRIGTVMERLLS